MKELFLKHKVLIFRLVGSFMLVVGFMMYFWTIPKEVLTQNEIAALNVQRMEARTSGGSGSSKQTKQNSSSKIIEELKNTQKKQVQYLMIIIMIMGVGFLGYSFIKKKEDE